jgi:hypothetical protein
MPKDLLHTLKDYADEKGYFVRIAYAGKTDRTLCAVLPSLREQELGF